MGGDQATYAILDLTDKEKGFGQLLKFEGQISGTLKQPPLVFGDRAGRMESLLWMGLLPSAGASVGN